MTCATRKTHNDLITAEWNLRDRTENPVPAGNYQFCIEMTEDDFEGSATCGTITIDGTGKIAQGTTTKKFPEFNAYTNNLYTSKVTSKPENKNTHSVTIVQNGDICKINLPSSESYSTSLISPSGKVIADNRGNGRTAILNVNSDKLKSGVYFIKVAQSGKVYTRKYIFGF